MEEVILLSDALEVLEGSSSNVFVQKGGKLYTASEGVLKGTVWKLVIEICEREGIPLSLTPVGVDTYKDWEGMLITSTSRLALSVDKVTFPAQMNWSSNATGLPSQLPTIEFTYDTSSITTRITQLVNESIRAASERVL